jgi:hypothetical protein
VCPTAALSLSYDKASLVDSQMLHEFRPGFDLVTLIRRDWVGDLALIGRFIGPLRSLYRMYIWSINRVKLTGSLLSCQRAIYAELKIVSEIVSQREALRIKFW